MLKLHWLKQRDDNGDPLYDINDIADLNEVLAVKYERERRAHLKTQHKAKVRRLLKK